MSRWRIAPMASALLAAVGIAACSGEPSPSATIAPSAQPSAAASPTTPPVARPTATTAQPAPSPTANLALYVVKKGDTLWAIANKHNVTLAALREANPQVTDPTKLRVGQELTIPSP